MRVLTGHDYYDSALAYGADREIVFAREKDRKIPVKDFPVIAESTFHIYKIKPDGNANAVNWWSSLSGMPSDVTCHKITVVVADMIYRGVEIAFGYGTDRRPMFCWTEAAMETALNKYGCTLHLQNTRGRWNTVTKNLGKYGIRDKEMIANYFARPKATETQLTYLIENRISIALYRGWLWDNRRDPTWSVNGFDLSTVEFYRVMDPHSIYQELSMWVGGVLPRSGAEMVKITDKVRAEKHGFDKWSFRKLPEKAR